MSRNDYKTEITSVKFSVFEPQLKLFLAMIYVTQNGDKKYQELIEAFEVCPTYSNKLFRNNHT